MRFFPFLAHVTRLWGEPHSPHTNSSVSAYLPEYFPSSVFSALLQHLPFAGPARHLLLHLIEQIPLRQWPDGCSLHIVHRAFATVLFDLLLMQSVT